MSPILTASPWSTKEETEIWKYVLADNMPYSPKSRIFWKGLVEKLKNRTLDSLKTKFLRILPPKIHETDFSIERKLKLYKNYKMIVDEKYLKIFEKYADLEVNENGCIIDYKMKTDRPEKRKSSDVADERAKKMRHADLDDQEEDDDLVFDGVVPGANKNAESTERDSPGLLLDEWGEVEDVKLDLVCDRYGIPAKIEEDELMFQQIFESPAETEQEDVTVTAVVSPKEEDAENSEAAVHDEKQLVQVEQRTDNQSEAIAEIFEVMKRMEKANEDQKTEFKEFKAHVKNLAASVEKMKNEMTIMKNKLPNSPGNDESPLLTNRLILNFINQLAALANWINTKILSIC